MKKLLFLFTIVFSLCLTSCSPDNPANTGTSTPFTLRYEIITSSPIVVPLTGTGITYENGTQQPETDNSFTSGTTWTREVTVTTPNRPFIAMLITGLNLSAPGTIIGRIYVNGTQVANVQNPTQVQGTSGNNGVVSMSYNIY